MRHWNRLKLVHGLLLVVLSSLCGCPGGGSSEVQRGAAIVVNPTVPKFGESFSLSVTPSASRGGYNVLHWAFLAPGSQQELSLPCQEAADALVVHCLPQVPMLYTVSVQVELGNAKPITLTRQIDLSSVVSPVNLVVDVSDPLQPASGVLGTRSSDRTLDRGNMYFTLDEPLTFDFSRTVSAIPLKYRINVGTGYQAVSTSFAYSFHGSVGDYPVHAQATDADGHVLAQVVFMVSISCQNPTLSVDANQISAVRDSSQDNLFHFSFGSGFVSGGRGTYQIRADVNDGVFDFGWAPLGGLDAYVVDSATSDLPGWDTRPVNFEVRDTICNAHVLASTRLPLQIPSSGGNPANRPGYQFFEALIQGSDSASPRDNTYFNAARNDHTAVPPLGPRLGCEFNHSTGKGWILAFQQYPLSDNSGSTPQNLHGFQSFNFNVQNYSDASSTSYGGLAASVTYTEAFQPDDFSRRNFSSSSCPLELKVNLSPVNVGSCVYTGGATGHQLVQMHIELVGSFHCDSMASDVGHATISISKGEFSCRTGEGSNFYTQVPCTPAPGSCGDGILQPGEQCDLGSRNGQANSGCSASCQGVAACGDGKVDPGEQCDEGYWNGHAGFQCAANCTWVPASCGDGVVQHGEQCDAGSQNGTPGSGCSASCGSVGSQCGNGIKEPGEQCDLGSQNGAPGSGCSASCRNVPVCGNGVVEGSEQCDDGAKNGTAGDLCNKDCTWKPPQ